MSPAEAAPRVQRNSAPPISSTGSVPASAISQKRKARWSRRSGSWRRGSPSSASSVASSSCMPWLKSLTVAMLVERVDDLAGHHRAGGGARRWSGRGSAACSGGSARRSRPSQTAMPSASQRLIRPITATAPTMAVTARPRVLTDSVTASVIARAVCCCFWAMRPAKSSSKKLRRLAERVAVEPRQDQRVEVGAEGQRVQRGAEAHQAGAQQQEEEPRRRAARASCSAKSPSGPRDCGEVDQPADDGRPSRPRWRRPRSRRRARSQIAGKAPREHPAHEAPEAGRAAGRRRGRRRRSGRRGASCRAGEGVRRGVSRVRIRRRY